jgi:hypothetical protein
MWRDGGIVRSGAMPTEPPHADGWRWPTIDAAWAAVGILVPVIVTLLTRTMAIDLAYQIRAGRHMLTSHAVVSTDSFTFTQGGQPWLNQQWGAQVLLALVHSAGSWAGILIVRGVIVLSVVSLLYLACRERGARPRTAALLTVAGWLTGIEIVDQLRPQQFAFALFMLCVWVLARRDRHPRGIWVLPIAVLLWANVHGSFPLAFVLLFFAWLEDRRRAPDAARIEVLAGLASLGATFVNPYGLRVWSYVWDLSTHPVVSHQVAEWGPPSVHSWTGRFFFLTLLGVAAYLARRRPPAEWRTLGELAFFAILGLLAIRGVVWWGLYWPVVMAGLIAAPARRPTADRSPINAVVIVCLVVLAGVATTVHLGTDPVTGGPDVLSYAPTDLIDAAAASVPAGTHAFVDELFASWSEYRAPQLPVAVDPRIEIFPKATWDDYISVSSGRDGWQAILDRWDVGVLVLHPDQSTGLLSVIDGDPDWRPVLQTDHGSVYERVHLKA